MTEKIEIWMTTETDGKEIRFGFDKDGRLYLNEKLIVTEQDIHLNPWVNVSVVVAAASTFSLALFDLPRFFRFGVH